ncbi:MAG: hypothetical protein ACK4GW_11935 [Pseudorhodobacter sp.]
MLLSPSDRGLLLDPVEVRAIANPDVPEVAISAHQIVDRLEMSYAVVKARMADRKGGALLPTVPGNGAAKVMVRIDVVDAFVRDHVGLLRLSKETGVHHVRLRRELDAADIRPIDDPERLRARIYRREDLQRL